MRRSILITVVTLFVLLGIGVFAVSSFNKSSGLTLTSYPEDSKKYDYTDLYTKEIQLGEKKIDMVVKTVTYYSEDNGDWLFGEYRFYTTDSESKLLATVGSTIPPEYKDGMDPFFSMKDITGDDIPEIFVLLERSASNLRSYEILTLEGNNLVNINIKRNGEKSNWVDFDAIAQKNGYIAMTWHGPSSDYKVGRNDYILTDDNSLILATSLVFDYDKDGEGCDVKHKGIGEEDFEVIAREEKNCGHTLDDFDKYLASSTSNIF